MKKILVNADDFGYSPGINRGILEAMNKGIATSTSVMVNRIAAKEADLLAHVAKDISVGLHLDLTEEGMDRLVKYITLPLYSQQALHRAFNDQVAKFQKLTGKLPDHIDSHHHIHILPKLKNIIKEFSQKNDIPVRSFGKAHFSVGFYGRSMTNFNNYEKISAERLISLIQNLPKGIHEIMTHPGYVDSELIQTNTKYLLHREYEIKALTDPKILNFFKESKDIQLINWKSLNNP